MPFQNKILESHESLRADDLWRQRITVESAQSTQVIVDGKSFLNFSSNNYLGLANHPDVRTAASDAIEKWGLGSGASHLVCGHQRPHEELEQRLAEFVGAEQAVLFSTGYMANLAVPQAFLGRDDLLLQDKLNHASLIDASMLCRAKFLRYNHLDVNHAREILDKHADKRTMIATDGVFSMNGSIAPIEKLADAIEGAETTTSKTGKPKLLLVDDAHGFGVLGKQGRGTLNQAGLNPTNDILMTGTLSKAIGAFGAFVAGDKTLIEQIIQRARPFIYTTALPSSIAAAANKGLELFQTETWRQEKVAENTDRFRKTTAERNIATLNSTTPIQSIVFGQPKSALRAAKILKSHSILVIAIRPPTVPQGTSRLRITISAEHSTDEIDRLISVLDSPEIRELQS